MDRIEVETPGVFFRQIEITRSLFFVPILGKARPDNLHVERGEADKESTWLQVGQYYGELEFARVTGWLELLQTGRSSRPRNFYEMIGCWGLELVEARQVKETVFEEDRLLLSIPESCREFSSELVEGEYLFHGGAGSIQFKSYVSLREFVRSLLAIRNEGEFEALRGCCEPGWVIGGECCAEMAIDFGRYREAFSDHSTLPEEVMLYENMLACLEKVAQDGVLFFG